MRDKFILPNELEVRLQSEPRPMVFTNGVFDILHRGHVTYLAQAKSLGAFLIVALNTDSSVKRLGKGVDRPINNTEDRIAVIEALESVDAVTSFAEDTPLNLIMRIKPDISSERRRLGRKPNSWERRSKTMGRISGIHPVPV